MKLATAIARLSIATSLVVPLVVPTAATAGSAAGEANSEEVRPTEAVISTAVADTVVPTSNRRFLDTRAGFTTFDGQHQAEGILGAASEIEVQIAGRGDVPADAVGVVANIAAVDTGAPGFLTVHNCADPRPTASAVNYLAGQFVANELVAGLTATGSLCVYTHAPTHLIIDVVGYLTPGSAIELVSPARVFESRAGEPSVDGESAGVGRLAAGQTAQFSVAGRGGVPVGADNVIVNLTAIAPSSAGFLVAHACLPDTPPTASMNYPAGAIRANEIVVPLSANGELCVFTLSDVDLAVDVVGYTSDDSSLTTLGGERFADTRVGFATVDGQFAGVGKLPADTQLTLQVAGRGGVPDDAVAVIAYVTAVEPVEPGFLTVSPCLGPVPDASSLNYLAGDTIGNELIVALNDDGELCAYTLAGTDLTIDITGYFAPVGADLSIIKTADTNPVLEGDTLTYTISVSNAGPLAATNVVVTESLPSGVSFVSTAGCAEDPAGVPTCSLGDIAAGASASYTVTVTVDPGTGILTNRATVTSETDDPDLTNNVTDVDTTIQAGTITIVKDAAPDGELDFSFTSDVPGHEAFTLDDDADPTLSNTLVMSDVLAGTYAVSETVPAGWEQTSATCTDGSPVTAIEVSPGESVTCTFTNTKRGTIIVENQTDPDGATDAFTFTGDAAGAISDNGQIIVSDLAPGTYTSTETPLGGFDLTDISCDDANSTGDVGSATATFNVEAGEVVTCVFTNTQRGTIIVEKQTDPDAASGSFTFTGDVAGTISDGGSLIVTSLMPGTYTSTENDPSPAHDLTNIICDDGASNTPSTGDVASRTATFNLDPGETITCVFTNTQRGTIVVEKQTLPDGDPASFTFTGDAAGSVSDGGTITVTSLEPGTYTSTENDPAPIWDLADISCDDANSTGDVASRTATFNVEPGEIVTCTFSNTKRATLRLATLTSPAGQAGSFDYIGSISTTHVHGFITSQFDLVPGSYGVTQTSFPAGLPLKNISCNDGNSTGNVGTSTVTFNLEPGEDVTCTFTNGNTAPEPVADFYSVPVNVVLDAGATSAGDVEVEDTDGVLTKGTDDSDPDGDALTVTGVVGCADLTAPFTNCATTGGGTVTMNADGTFTYLSQPGESAGTDTFQYLASDGTISVPGTVTITFGDTIWFLDSAAVGGNGTSIAPFNTVTAFTANATDEAGDIIFVSGTFTDAGFALLANQQLIGDTIGLTSGALTIAPSGGSAPTISSSTGKIVVFLSTNNTVRGFTIGGSVGAGSIVGSAFGTPVINNVTINGPGALLDLTNGNVTNIAMGAMTSTSSNVPGLSLDNVTGTFNAIAPVSTANALGIGIEVVNSSATVNFSSTVDVTNSGGAGVRLNNNTGSVTFADLDINNSTSNQRGIHATGGGSVLVTTGTVDSGSATAVELDGVSLGVLFRSVSSVNGSTAGIRLTNTTGFFTVSGSGVGCQSNAASCAGGAITGKTGNVDGIVLSNVTNVSLNDMNVSNNTGNGIIGTTVNGLTLNDLRIDGNADSVSPDEAGVNLSGLTGSATVESTTISNSHEHNMIVRNSSGTLTNLVANNSTFGPNPTGSGANGLLFEMTGGTHTLSVTNSTFNDNRSNGIQATASAGTINVNVSTSSFTSSSQVIDQGQNVAINIGTSGTANTNFNILNNPVIEDHRSNAINVFSNGLGTVTGTIQGNTIGTVGDQSSGSLTGHGVRVANEGTGNKTVLIDGNIIQEIGELFVSGGMGISVAESVGAGTTNVTVTNNTVDQIRNDRAMRLSAIIAGGTMCSHVSGNSFSNFDLGPQLRQTSGVHNHTATNEATLEAANGGVDFSISGTISFGSPSCALP